MLPEHLCRALDPDAADAVGRATGNPLLPRGDAADARRGRRPGRADGRLEPLAVESLRVPETVQAVLAARLDRLDEDELSVLQRAAVIGQVFWWGRGRGPVAPGGGRRVAGRLQALVRKGLIKPDAHVRGRGRLPLRPTRSGTPPTTRLRSASAPSSTSASPPGRSSARARSSTRSSAITSKAGSVVQARAGAGRPVEAAARGCRPAGARGTRPCAGVTFTRPAGCSSARGLSLLERDSSACARSGARARPDRGGRADERRGAARRLDDPADGALVLAVHRARRAPAPQRPARRLGARPRDRRGCATWARVERRE